MDEISRIYIEMQDRLLRDLLNSCCTTSYENLRDKTPTEIKFERFEELSNDSRSISG